MTEFARRQPVPETPGTCWRPMPPSTRFSLRVDVDAAAARAAADPAADLIPIATIPCRAVVRGDWAALWLGPDEQLLIGPDQTGPDLIATVARALHGVAHSLVDVSHRQGALEVTGPHAAALINAGCPLDLDLATAPVTFCSRTILGKAEIVLWRRTDDGFQLQAGRSFMPYVTAFLAVACISTTN